MQKYQAVIYKNFEAADDADANQMCSRLADLMGAKVEVHKFEEGDDQNDH